MSAKTLSMIERMCAYTSATGFPPTGTHRKLTDQIVMRLGVPCDSCDGSGVQFSDGERHYCSDCHGFLRRLCAADVVRLYQIVTARFPELCGRVPNVQTAADRWHCGRSVPATAPKYFGREPPPAAIPAMPDVKAQLVASITWRSGGRSEYLWTGSAADNLCVLWERTPDLLLEDGEPWTEVFAWAHGGIEDPSLSARRLLHQGWAESNPAYEWLAAPRMSAFLGLTKFFFVNRDAMLSAQLLQSFFCAAVRVRTRTTASLSANKPSKPPGTRKTLNVGPYPFGTKLADARHPMPTALRAGSIPAAEPTKLVAEARILPFRRSRQRITERSHGDPQ